MVIGSEQWWNVNGVYPVLESNWRVSGARLYIARATTCWSQMVLAGRPGSNEQVDHS